MSDLTLRPRASSLRCAYCHDGLADEPSWRCPRCATQLHEDCFDLALTCPVLGCIPRRLVAVRARVAVRAGATLGLLLWWLSTYSSVWAALLWVVPGFTKVFDKRRVRPPAPTEALRLLVRFSHSGAGVAVGLLVLGVTIILFKRFPESPVIRSLLIALTLAGLAFFPFAFIACVYPLVNMARV